MGVSHPQSRCPLQILTQRWRGFVRVGLKVVHHTLACNSCEGACRPDGRWCPGWEFFTPTGILLQRLVEMTVEQLVDLVHWVVFIFHVRVKPLIWSTSGPLNGRKKVKHCFAPHWIPVVRNPRAFPNSSKSYISPGFEGKIPQRYFETTEVRFEPRWFFLSFLSFHGKSISCLAISVRFTRSPGCYRHHQDGIIFRWGDPWKPSFATIAS